MFVFSASTPRIIFGPGSKWLQDPTAPTPDRPLFMGGPCGYGCLIHRIALQHKLAYTVADCCNLPHPDTHAILLPHTVHITCVF
jgi:hypothetical protein